MARRRSNVRSDARHVRAPAQAFRTSGMQNSLDSGDPSLIWGRAAVICPCADWSGGIRLPDAARPVLGLDHSVGEDGNAPERPLAIGEGLGNSRHRPKECRSRCRGQGGACRGSRRSFRRSQRRALRRRASDHRSARRRGSRRHRSDRGDAAPLRGRGAGDAPAHSPASFPAERRVRRGGAGREPHLDPHLARRGLCGARRVHVRQGQSRTPASRCCARPSRPSASRSTKFCAGEAPERRGQTTERRATGRSRRRASVV